MNSVRIGIASVIAATMASANAHATDDLTALSDEFNDASTIVNWQRIYQVEGWGNNALEQFDIHTTRPGRMFMMPYSSSWYEEWRGELTFKNVTGDFVITTDVEPTRRNGPGAPQSQYSLAGIMVRTPRAMTQPAQWTPNGQNYVFLSLGAASNPGQFQFEVKTTSNSTSTLFISNGIPRAVIQVARLGPHFIMLRRPPGGPWQIHRRYFRPDMPATLQAGLTVYTDWPLCETVGVENQNTRVLTNGAPLNGGGTVSGANPDLIAAFDYVRYARPVVPTGLSGGNFSNPAAVSDAQLLSFLGDNANPPAVPLQFRSVTKADANTTRLSITYANGTPLETNRLGNYEVYASAEITAPFTNWTRLLPLTITNGALHAEDTESATHRFYRALERP